MYTVFDLFKVGIGPSSSHTVGPMVAAKRFVDELQATERLEITSSIRVVLYGSLALTGHGHATDGAILLGLTGASPEHVDPDLAALQVHEIRQRQEIQLLGRHTIPFAADSDLQFRTQEALAHHPNGMRMIAWGPDGSVLLERCYYSLGGGFVVSEDEAARGLVGAAPPPQPLAFPFGTAAELLDLGRVTGLRIADLVLANEASWRPERETLEKLDGLWQVMQSCIERGCHHDGELPGGLHVRRRAAAIYRKLQQFSDTRPEPEVVFDWLSMTALAVNEENAAGGRVVTAPTNGAAGVIPAVLAYYQRFVPGASQSGRRTFLLTAAAIGMLYKRNASLSAAEMGCQGEVGVACSMAAGGLAAAMGGANEQVENAAEIGMEHNLGLTCDPIRGLVQVPCIERNTMGAVKAVNAARLAVLYGDGTHRVALDRVIETMRQTGIDMQSKYKETSLGGLAVHVNVTEC
jgi:L-serine dehydratase